MSKENVLPVEAMKTNSGKPNGTKNRTLNRKTGALIFYIAMMAIPVLQFVIMYIGVNINSIFLAFKEYKVNTGEYELSGDLWRNFRQVFITLSDPNAKFFPNAITNSLLVFALGLIINLPLSIIFSYYIYKKMPGNKFFRVALYLPSIVSSVVMVTIYFYMMEQALPTLISMATGDKKPLGFVSNPDTAMPMLILYSIFFSFGATTMVISGSMSGINTSVIEASRLDGCNLFQEFIYIVFPLSFNVIKLQLITALVGIFTNQLNLYTFFGLQASPRLYTIGYYLYRGVLAEGKAYYPFYAAMGLIFSVIAIPIIFFFRSMFDRWDPAVEKKSGRKL